ncbi:hypothetical protein BSKO_03979 [Bryopsis sp. KO-2023]|nr:hypothetical protein BSKO_03979 [Bryopsis sp. KO-2023]
MLRTRSRNEATLLEPHSKPPSQLLFQDYPSGKKCKKPSQRKLRLLLVVSFSLVLFWLLNSRLPGNSVGGWEQHPPRQPLLTIGIDAQEQEEVISWLRAPPSQRVKDKLLELGFGGVQENIIVIPITADEKYLPLLFNLVISIERVGVNLGDVLLTIVDLPEPVPDDILQLFNRLGLKYLLISEFEPPRSYTQTIETLTGPHCWHLRNVMNMALLKLGHRVFQMDADIVLIRDYPWSYVDPEKYNIEAAAATNPLDLTEEWGGTLNCGFLSLSPSPAMLEFYEDYIVYEFVSQPDDQVALNELMDKENAKFQKLESIRSGSVVSGGFSYGGGQIGVRILDRTRYMCGQALNTFQRNSQSLSRCDGGIEARALHPTHVHGAASGKISWLREKGHWFLKSDWRETLNRFNQRGRNITLADLSNKLNPHACLAQILSRRFSVIRPMWMGLPFTYNFGACRTLDQTNKYRCSPGDINDELTPVVSPTACENGKRCLVFLGPDQNAADVLRGALEKIGHLKILAPQAWNDQNLEIENPLDALTVADARLADPHAPMTFKNLAAGGVKFVVTLTDPVPYVAESIAKMVQDCKMAKDVGVPTATCDFRDTSSHQDIAEGFMQAFTQKCESACNGCREMNWLTCMRRTPEISLNPVAGGMYGPQVAWWFDFFPPDEFIFIHSENLAQNSAEELQRLLHFIGEPIEQLPIVENFEYPKADRDPYLAEIFDWPTHEFSHFLRHNGHNISFSI